MPKKPKRPIPAWLQSAAAAGVRSAMTLPLVAGIGPSLALADRLGRWFGALPINRTRFQRAVDHLAFAFPDWSIEQRRACALDSYSHLFQLAVEVAYTPRLVGDDSWHEHVEIVGIDPAGRRDPRSARDALRRLMAGRPAVMITGHCGNWEVLGYTMAVLGFQIHALYRPLDNLALDRWVREVRQRKGLVLLDKFGATENLPRLLALGHPVAFVADQNAGDRGLFVPFFGRLASTYKTIGLLAMQHDAPVICAMARRIHPALAPGRTMPYRVEVSDVIEPEHWKGQPDPLYYITARYRLAIERMVRSAPEQYLWMHRIWKSRPRHERDHKPVPPALAAKLRALPWMDAADVDRVIEQSRRDAGAA
ncbi:MAG: lysophospholipid acyltransferase family protein [Phycisphaerae bacterium]|nr:lysophospholipid acyltransferase family protein [Phycisphaerae bacterium]